MLNTLILTIELFEWCSGQKVNWEKFALCGINVDVSKLHEVASRLHCNVEYLSFMYFDIPLGGHPKKSIFWQLVINKI